MSRCAVYVGRCCPHIARCAAHVGKCGAHLSKCRAYLRKCAARLGKCGPVLGKYTAHPQRCNLTSVLANVCETWHYLSALPYIFPISGEKQFMIPSRTWFPLSLQDRATWYNNFDTQFQVVGASLGFGLLEVTSVSDDNSVIQFLIQAETELKVYEDAVWKYRILMTEGDIGDPAVAFPALPTYGTPASVPRGIFERLVSIVNRIRVAPAYTDEVGALLGIIPATPSVPTEFKPVIKTSESVGGYSFDVNVTRLGMPGFKIQIQRSGETGWKDNTFATNNPATVVITPTTPDQPERVLVRAILLDNNVPVGTPFDPTYVTANP